MEEKLEEKKEEICLYRMKSLHTNKRKDRITIA